MTDTVSKVETKKELEMRKGFLCKNREGRITSDSCRTAADRGWGYVAQIGKTRITKNMSLTEIRKILSKAPDGAYITEFYPEDYCKGCKRPSWHFLRFETRGHSTCPKCGLTKKLVQNGIQLYLGEDGTACKNKWECTPGMKASDTYLRNKRGNRLEIAGQRLPSHKRHEFLIMRKIDEITDDWHFSGIDSLIKRAKVMLHFLYKTFHYDGEENDDNVRKMPHGVCAIAAACFYAAVLERESRTKERVALCSLPAIQEAAQKSRDLKRNRRVRDVTDVKILQYVRLLKSRNIYHGKVPHISAETLRFHPKSVIQQTARMALFNMSYRVKFFLPICEKWGLRVVDTNKGVLKIESAVSSGIAFKTGLRKGDLIFQIGNETPGIDCTPAKFAKMVAELKKKNVDKSIVEITIMRKKKK